jgi:hypothetical protein
VNASPSRTIHCADALEWLATNEPIVGSSTIASLPDISEFPSLSVAEWEAWFIRAATLVLRATPEDGIAVFYQSDIKREGLWVDKGFLCQRAALETGHALLWHKVVCRVEPGSVTFGRPSYSHLFAFSKSVRLDPARSTADVLPDARDSVWTRGMSVKAALLACREIRESARSHTVVNPFCGHGTAVAAANALGMDAIGIEKSAKRAEKARILTLASD